MCRPITWEKRPSSSRPETSMCRPGWSRRRSCSPSCLLRPRSEEHTSELQSHLNLVCRLLLEKKKQDDGKIYEVGTCSGRWGTETSANNTRRSKYFAFSRHRAEKRPPQWHLFSVLR